MKLNLKEDLNPTIIQLGFVSFFTDMASEMLYPLTPIFLSTVLGASMSELGAIEGFAEGLASLLKTYSGVWSDRIGDRKNFVLFGYSLSALAKPLIGAAQGPFGVFVGRCLDRLGKGIRSAPRDAMIADSVLEKGGTGAAFGWHRAMDTLGATCGPLITIYLLSKPDYALRSIYFWTIIPGFLSILFIFALKERKNDRPTDAHPAKFSFSKSWNELSKDYKKFIFVFGLFCLANSSDTFLIMHVKNSGVSVINTVLMYCGYNLIYALTSPYFGKLSDSVNRAKILSFGFFLFATVYFGFSLSHEWPAFVMLFLIYGIYMAATDGVGKAFALDFVDKRNKATALGLLGSVTGLCSIIASIWCGVLWDHFGPAPAFQISAAAALFSGLLLLFSFRRV